MAEDRIQLKQEEVVDGNIVLNDINPKTNTKSIDDPTSGTSLDKTIERMWNAINNKLSRIVNSVNGRTGVVVLDSSDVGLDKVDNVSFDDIKQWVIKRIADEFGFKRIHLFESLDELEDTITNKWLNDPVFESSPFYSRHGFINNTSKPDYRGYIGYITKESNGNLSYVLKVLDTIGQVDNSVIYNEKGSQGVNKPSVDYSESGNIGINIWQYEDALEVYNAASGNKTDSGLRINKDNIVPKVYWYDGVYGNGSPDDPDALLYLENPPSDAKTVDFYMRGTKLTYVTPATPSTTKFNEPNFIKQSFKINDIIICNFNDENYLLNPDPDEGHEHSRIIDPRMNPLLTMRSSCIGQVTQAPTIENPDANYIIKFYNIKVQTSRGIKYETIHTNKNDVSDQALSIDLIEVDTLYDNQTGKQITFISQNGLSGMNTMKPYNYGMLHTIDNVTRREFQTILPSGLTKDIFKNNLTDVANEQGSLFILPNYSLCIVPYEAFIDINNNIIPNWPMTAPPVPKPPSARIRGDEGTNLLGINLEKSINVDDENRSWATNISGLRINSDEDNLDGEEWFGNNSTDVINHSGGLSVNVGNFLEIGSTATKASDSNAVHKSSRNYYEEGKVNVRIDTGRGLKASKDIDSENGITNALAIAIPEHGALPIKLLKLNEQENPASEYADKHIYFNDIYAREGGLHFTSAKYTGDVDNDGVDGILSINTGIESEGLCIRNNVIAEAAYKDGVIDEANTVISNGVLGIKPYCLGIINNENGRHIRHMKETIDISNGITDDDIFAFLPDNMYMSIPKGETDFANDLGVFSDLNSLIFHDKQKDGFVEYQTIRRSAIFVAGGKRYVYSGDSNELFIPFIKYYSITSKISWDNMYTELLNLEGKDPTDSLVTSSINARQVHVLIVRDDETNKSKNQYQIRIMVCTINNGKIHIAVGDPDNQNNGLVQYYEKGLRLRYSESRGLTPFPYINGDKASRYNSNYIQGLGIKIFDTSAGSPKYDPYRHGGLRFGSDGYLSIRINNNNDFSGIDPSKYLGRDNLTQGTRGLNIDENNVLGIQLDPNSDDLFIDNKGCLRLGNGIGIKAKLTISGDGKSVVFNGTEDIEVSFGPGFSISIT